MKNALFVLFGFLILIGCETNSVSPSSTNSSGSNGSYSQIIVHNNYLYGISGNQISTVDISDKENVKEIDTQVLAYNIESLFIDNQTLFIGSSSRFYIFSIDEDTGIPIPLSEENYNINFLADQFICFNDPIIADVTHAYVTLHTTISNNCRSETINELRVYNIADLNAPVLINTTDMTEPKGLAKDGNTLFVCDGYNGLKIYDVSTPSEPVESYHFEGFDSYDLILNNKIMQVVATDQLLQFDYSDLDSIYLLGILSL